MLGDRLLRHGIDTENPVRLFDPECPEWDRLSSGDVSIQKIYCNPFSQWHELGLSEKYPQGEETLRVEFDLAHKYRGDRIMGRFNTWCRGAMQLGNRDGIDARVLDLDEAYLSTDPEW